MYKDRANTTPQEQTAQEYARAELGIEMPAHFTGAELRQALVEATRCTAFAANPDDRS